MGVAGGSSRDGGSLPSTRMERVRSSSFPSSRRSTVVSTRAPPSAAPAGAAARSATIPMSALPVLLDIAPPRLALAPRPRREVSLARPQRVEEPLGVLSRRRLPLRRACRVAAPLLGPGVGRRLPLPRPLRLGRRRLARVVMAALLRRSRPGRLGRLPVAALVRGAPARRLLRVALPRLRLAPLRLLLRAAALPLLAAPAQQHLEVEAGVLVGGVARERVREGADRSVAVPGGV